MGEDYRGKIWERKSRSGQKVINLGVNKMDGRMMMWLV